MARLVRDNRLETRTARLNLKLRPKPYYRSLDPGLALGYFRGRTGGTWIARKYVGDEKYVTRKLGIADDKTDRDGTRVLSYADAITAARDWWSSPTDTHNRALTTYTVADALDDYVKHLHNKGSRGVAGTVGKIEAHIRPALGASHIRELTTRAISEFQARLASHPRLTRNGRPLTDALTGEREETRARRATANRTMAVLKAALNLAYREGRAATDDAWRRVRPFPNTSAARIRYLTQSQIVELDAHLPSDFRDLFHGALVTGARYQELASLRVADVDLESGTVLFRETKNGKPRHTYLPDEGRRVFSRVTESRTQHEFVFLRANGSRWKQSDQARPMSNGCKRAGISPAVSFHDLRHTFGALLAQRGVPMRVIAEALGHSDTRITEKHYAHLSPSYVAAAIRGAFPTLLPDIERGDKKQSLR